LHCATLWYSRRIGVNERLFFIPLTGFLPVTRRELSSVLKKSASSKIAGIGVTTQLANYSPLLRK